MGTEVFEFDGAEGQRLAGRLETPRGPPRGHAVFAHCFSCSKSSRAAVYVSRALAAEGIGVLRFDFTGLEQSQGDFADSTFSGSVADVIAAAEALRRAGRPPRLLIGHSLGGAAVLAAAGRLKGIEQVVTLASPFEPREIEVLLGDAAAEIETRGEALVHLGGQSFLIRRQFLEDLRGHSQAARINALARPLLVMHASDDRVVPLASAMAIFAAAVQPKSFVSLGDMGHLLERREDAAYVAGVIAAWAARGLEAERARELLAGSAEGSALVKTPSVFGYAQTLARLEAAIAEHGLTVFARIDHAAAARDAGLALAPTLVMLVGSPRAGTPLMAQTADLAIELPLRLLVRSEGGDALAEIAFEDPVRAGVRRGAPGDAEPALAKMAALLRMLAETAAGSVRQPR